MAPAQKIESRAPVMALSLFAILVAAKTCMAVGRHSMGLLLFADDALVAAAFGIVVWLTRKHPSIGVVLYVGITAYVALNVPLARLTSSAMTLQMMRATGSALSDSIAHHLTAANVALIAGIVFVATGCPPLLRRVPRRIQSPAVIAVVMLALAGLVLPQRSGGMRNAFTTLVRSALPRVTARSIEADWRRPLLSTARSCEDLTFLRGAAGDRNIVVIGLESTGAKCLKPYGSTNDPMPNLTRLAGEAILFENAYAVYPESIKGLFSVLCSRYPAFDTDPGDYAQVQTPAFAEMARRAGYRTALFHSGRFMYLGMRSIIDNRGFEILEDAGHIGGNHNSSFGVDEPSTVNRMLNWIDRVDARERFCLMYLPIAGHHPYEVPADGPFAGADEYTRYLNSLHYGDTALGELLAGLKARGLYTNTLFVIYGDHGEAFGQHEGNFGHTFFLYEENVRVPLMIAAPGLLERPMRVTNVASLIDIAPTMAALLGWPAAADWQGCSLLDETPRTALFFTDYSRPLVGIRDGRWKAICELGSAHAEFFDLLKSPGEDNDLEAISVLARCRRHLESWAAAQKSLLKP